MKNALNALVLSLKKPIPNKKSPITVNSLSLTLTLISPLYDLRQAEVQILVKIPLLWGESLSADGAVCSSSAVEHFKCQFIPLEEAEVSL